MKIRNKIITPNGRVDYDEMLLDLAPFGIQATESENYRALWKTHHLGNKIGIKTGSQKVILEIGPGTGEFIMNLARKNPENLYLAVEKKFKQTYKIARKVKNADLKNLKIIRNRAERLPYLFSPGELTETYLLFPDPWPKTAQNKNRLFTEKFLKNLHLATTDEGRFNIRTDSREYFDWMLEEIEKVTNYWKPIEATFDLYSQETFCGFPTDSIEKTLFENIWIKDGKKINAVSLLKI
jgi:tRNA (guanine-N7-)-methyltransferase